MFRCERLIEGKLRKKIIFYMFFLMYKYGCLYAYQRFIMLDKGMKWILKFGQRQMDVAILISRDNWYRDAV